jgi:hypothetical protein
MLSVPASLGVEYRAMAKSVDRVLGDALKLGADERAQVAAELLATLAE